jgi:hypothetical protein
MPYHAAVPRHRIIDKNRPEDPCAVNKCVPRQVSRAHHNATMRNVACAEQSSGEEEEMT